jgi:ribosomal protein S18 acetylase RimI-like enzyme
LYVDENFRGMGLATALITDVKRAALKKKCSELYWITREGNEIAKRIYDKLATKSDFVRYEILLGQDK